MTGEQRIKGEDEHPVGISPKLESVLLYRTQEFCVAILRGYSTRKELSITLQDIVPGTLYRETCCPLWGFISPMQPRKDIVPGTDEAPQRATRFSVQWFFCLWLVVSKEPSFSQTWLFNLATPVFSTTATSCTISNYQATDGSLHEASEAETDRVGTGLFEVFPLLL